MTTWFLALLALWLAFNLAAPWAPLLLAQRISPGRLPAELLKRGEARHVRFYEGHTYASYAFSAWAPPRLTVVVFNRAFLRGATPELLRFVVAHELGHAAARHHIWRWLAITSGAVLLPFVRAALRRQEETADEYATKLTGLKKEFFPKYFGKESP